MGGPFQALAAAVALALLPGLGWASAAVVALVALRKNLNDAMVPFVGAVAVAIAAHWAAGDVSQLGTVLAALTAALVLANVRSLSWSLLAAGLASLAYMAVVLNVAQSHVASLVALFQPAFDDFVAEMGRANPEAATLLQTLEVRQIVVEGLVWVTTLGSTAAILVARWLQAGLYNPGGFRSEFHRLRLTPAVAAVLALMLWLGQTYPQARMLLPVVMVPMLMAGLALVHGLLGAKPNNGPLLVFFYVGLLLTSWVGVMVVISAAVIDSFVDFRNRIQKRYE